MTDDETARLEREADAILRQDAKDQGFIAKSGRGYTKYARAVGITTADTLDRTYKHEAVGFTEEQVDHLANESETSAIKRRRQAASPDQTAVGGDENP